MCSGPRAIYSSLAHCRFGHHCQLRASTYPIAMLGCARPVCFNWSGEQAQQSAQPYRAAHALERTNRWPRPLDASWCLELRPETRNNNYRPTGFGRVEFMFELDHCASRLAQVAKNEIGELNSRRPTFSSWIAGTLLAASPSEDTTDPWWSWDRVQQTNTHTSCQQRAPPQYIPDLDVSIKSWGTSPCTM